MLSEPCDRDEPKMGIRIEIGAQAINQPAQVINNQDDPDDFGDVASTKEAAEQLTTIRRIFRIPFPIFKCTVNVRILANTMRTSGRTLRF
jgi:hypothetical protein